jgi:ubiquinone/menaquinone biosynthesis C-methylase UbiE
MTGLSHTDSKPIFDDLALKYDNWFDSPQGIKIFAREIECLQQLTRGLQYPWLEIGVGTGRFAQALGIQDGVDPSSEVLKKAKLRNINVWQAKGENLPFSNNVYGAVFLIVTLCFVADPAAVFSECARVLKTHGNCIVGFVPSDSSWGQYYLKKAQEGHSFYSHSSFYTIEQTVKTAESAGFSLIDSRSCLFDDPNTEHAEYKRSVSGLVDDAGFVGLKFSLVK